jgi:hypothetical protein
VKYSHTKFDRDDLIRATEAFKNFTGAALVLWSDNPVMPAAPRRSAGSSRAGLGSLVPLGDDR